MYLPVTYWRPATYLALGVLFCSFLGSSRPANATQVAPFSLTETIRHAQTVVVGEVLSKNSRWGTEAKRWMLTDYEVRVEEVVVAEEGTLPLGETIVVTYWGGTLEGQTQEVADTRLPQIGERLLLMLKKGWQKEVSFSPVVGLNYGLLSVAPVQLGGPVLVSDAHGAPLVGRADGQVRWRADGGAEAGLPTIELSAFTAWVRENVRAIKAAPSELKPQADRSDPRVMNVFAKTPSPDSGGSRYTAPETAGNVPAAEGTPEIPLRPEFWTNPAPSGQETAGDNQLDYSYAKRANAPVTINNFPSSWTPWSPEDQYQMSKWNYYADIFRISGSPTGTFGWLDGRWDLCGWPTSAQMQAVYGAGWDFGMVAVCKRGWNASNIILEADIALNPEFSFTLDDEWVFNGSSAYSFRQVMTHELGHMWGLDHNFQALAVMNYMPQRFSAFGLPYMDDAEGIRSAFPAETRSRTDLGIYLYYASENTVKDALYSIGVTAGSTLSVWNYHLENVGTTTIATPTVEWYLTASRNFNGVTYFLGTSTHESLVRFQSVNLANTPRSFTVPTNVPAGNYYLAAFIRNDGGATQASFPFGNNFAFSRTTLQVYAATGSLQVTINPSGANSAGAQWRVDGGPYQNSGVTVPFLSVGDHTISFKPVAGWTTPSDQTVSVSANSTATATGTYVAQTGSLQVTISPAGAVSAGAQWQVDGGTFQNSGATVSNLSVGTHTVSFKPVSGWTTPSSQAVTINANSTTSTSGTYVAVPSTGALQVTISPAGAVSAGAQWSVDGGAYQNSGATVSNLAAGTHVISFKPISGWTTPANQNINVSSNVTSTTSGTYVAQPGALQVTISPPEAVTAGAQWSVNGGAYQNSGATVSNLSVGSHTVSFKPISGWTTPANQAVTISSNVTTTTSGTYAAAEPQPTPTPTPTPAPVPTATPTPAPTATATPIPTAAPSATPTPTATPIATPTPTAEPNPSPSATPLPRPRQLLNIATRLRVQTGENVLIGGLIVTGSEKKKIIIRAIGPSLSAAFDGALQDTTLELFQGDTLLASNDNWKDSQQGEIEETTIPPSHDRESAIVYTLDPGFYTAVVGGKGATSGIGVIEVYDLDQAADSQLANIASRGLVEAGENVMIGGLIVGGNGTADARILLRAIGPSLAAGGVAGALQDPVMELRDANGDVVAENDNWRDNQPGDIEATTIPPGHPAESALVIGLPSGNYTAVVRGKNGGLGVGLVEVYNLR